MEAKEPKKPFFLLFGAHEPHRNYSYGSGAALGAKKIAMIKDIPPFFPESAQLSLKTHELLLRFNLGKSTQESDSNEEEE